ncbi:MAG: hypothetical protein E7170_03740 [Firmicutes bacterium]|nr:hypothetical protein [Bacillota bacterium]
MEIRYFSIRLQEKLLNESWIIEKDMFIKSRKNRCSLESLYLIDENRHKLTSKYFAYLTHIYINQTDDVEALGGKFYDGYVDFRNLYLDKNINKSQVIKECIEAILELENIGVDYTDIHDKNIIVNKESHMKLVDLDETKTIKTYKSNKNQLLISLILQSMLFFEVKSSIWHWVAPKTALLELNSKKVLSYEFLDTIEGKKDFTSLYSNIDKYLEELRDSEKSFVLRKELRDKYPKWF